MPVDLHKSFQTGSTSYKLSDFPKEYGYGIFGGRGIAEKPK